MRKKSKSFKKSGYKHVLKNSKKQAVENPKLTQMGMWKYSVGNILKGTKVAVMEQENFEYKDQKIIDVHMEKEVKNSFINYIQ